MEMVHTSDLPARTGIGSSSAFTVGFLNSLYALDGKMASKKQLALDAIHVEQNLIKENVGSQDHTASAFGGFNRIDFGGVEKIRVMPIIINQERLKLLQDHLMLFFTGFSRSASEIAKEQISQTPLKYNELSMIGNMVDKANAVLCSENSDIKEFGRLLDESWKIKRGLTHLISTNSIDAIYERGLKAGAIGGKLCGAGGGGFILFFASPEVQPKIREELKDLLYVPFKFENQGSQIIFNNPQNFV
jgi:D-glycero-alpha-D-manno-heptose-7-phosphate kinase